MNFIVANWMLILVALISGGMLLAPMLKPGQAGLSPSGAVTLVNREKAVVIDVCSAAEYAAGHVVGARHVPLDELEQKLPTVVKNKATPLVLVCASGARAGKAQAVARALGYAQVHVLAGGLKAWRQADMPVQTGQA